MKKSKYKIGDKVRIKSLDWYNENKDVHGVVVLLHNMCFCPYMATWCGKVMTIYAEYKGCYFMKEDESRYMWTDEMIEGLVEEEVGLVDNLSSRWVNEFNLPDGYQFKDENGNVINATKIVLEKKKKEYPKTYEECCEMLGVFRARVYDDEEWRPIVSDFECDLDVRLAKLRELLICRDAYWKIAGDWKPDLEDGEFYFMYYSPCGNIILKDHVTLGIHCNVILAFPTEEMRNAFYENFKELIEFVKELL